MKKRFFLAAMLCICILFSMSVNTVNAEVKWYAQCDIFSVGSATDGLGLVYLAGGISDLPGGWYKLGIDTKTSNQMIATALTAMATGGLISVAVDVSEGNNPIIQTFVWNPVR